MNNDKEITIKYKLSQGGKIRLFGNQFTINNKKNCFILIKGAKYELSEFYDRNDFNEEELEIKLIFINDITDISYFFSECINLISIINLSKLDTSNIKYMNNLFYGCESLIYISEDISTWVTNKVINMNQMFFWLQKIKNFTKYIKLVFIKCY